MDNKVGLVLLVAAFFHAGHASYHSSNPQMLSNAMMLREMVARMGTDLADTSPDYLPPRLEAQQRARSQAYGGPSLLDMEEAMDVGPLRGGFPQRQLRDDLINIPRVLRDNLERDMQQQEPDDNIYMGDFSMQPALRDQEYLSHSHLLGDMLAQMPADGNYGTMRIKPASGDAPSATTERKTEGVLPAYCNPPNPCPLGYTSSDGCQEVFQNTAAYSRNYQAEQACMCDTEHMFHCPDSDGESEIGAIARSIHTQGMVDSTLDKIIDRMKSNPYLQGDKLPVHAKKGISGH